MATQSQYTDLKQIDATYFESLNKPSDELKNQILTVLQANSDLFLDTLNFVLPLQQQISLITQELEEVKRLNPFSKTSIFAILPGFIKKYETIIEHEKHNRLLIEISSEILDLSRLLDQLKQTISKGYYHQAIVQLELLQAKLQIESKPSHVKYESNVYKMLRKECESQKKALEQCLQNKFLQAFQIKTCCKNTMTWDLYRILPQTDGDSVIEGMDETPSDEVCHVGLIQSNSFESDDGVECSNDFKWIISTMHKLGLLESNLPQLVSSLQTIFQRLIPSSINNEAIMNLAAHKSADDRINVLDIGSLDKMDSIQSECGQENDGSTFITSKDSSKMMASMRPNNVHIHRDGLVNQIIVEMVDQQQQQIGDSSSTCDPLKKHEAISKVINHVRLVVDFIDNYVLPKGENDDTNDSIANVIRTLFRKLLFPNINQQLIQYIVEMMANDLDPIDPKSTLDQDLMLNSSIQKQLEIYETELIASGFLLPEKMSPNESIQSTNSISDFAMDVSWHIARIRSQISLKKSRQYLFTHHDRDRTEQVNQKTIYEMFKSKRDLEGIRTNMTKERQPMSPIGILPCRCRTSILNVIRQSYHFLKLMSLEDSLQSWKVNQVYYHTIRDLYGLIQIQLEEALEEVDPVQSNEVDSIVKLWGSMLSHVDCTLIIHHLAIVNGEIQEIVRQRGHEVVQHQILSKMDEPVVISEDNNEINVNLGVTDKTIQRFNWSLADLMPFFEESAQKCYEKPVRFVNQQLLAMLDLTGDFYDTSDGLVFKKCIRIVRQVVEYLHMAGDAWRPILQELSFFNTMGRLVDQVAKFSVKAIQSMQDISENESQSLTKILTEWSPLNLIFTKAPVEEDDVEKNNDQEYGKYSGFNAITLEKEYVKNWSRLVHIQEILSMSMIEIVQKYKDGGFSFNATEVVGMIEALFVKSNFRQENIRTILSWR